MRGDRCHRQPHWAIWRGRYAFDRRWVQLAGSVPPTGYFGDRRRGVSNSTDCIAVGASLLVSHDGGATWAATTVPGGTGPLRTVSCASTTSCIAIGDNAQGLSDPNAGASAIESTDGGNTWTSVSFPAGTATLDQVSCDTATQCVAGAHPLPVAVLRCSSPMMEERRGRRL